MIKDEQGQIIVEYVLITLLTLGLLIFLVQVSGSNFLRVYIGKVTSSFLIKVGGIGDLGSAVKRLTRF